MPWLFLAHTYMHTYKFMSYENISLGLSFIHYIQFYFWFNISSFLKMVFFLVSIFYHIFYIFRNFCCYRCCKWNTNSSWLSTPGLFTCMQTLAYDVAGWLLMYVWMSAYTFAFIFVYAAEKFSHEQITTYWPTREKKVSFLAIFLLCYGCYRRMYKKFLFLYTHSHSLCDAAVDGV